MRTRYLIIQACQAKTPNQKGLYILTAREDVRPKTKANMGDRVIATRAQVPDKLLRTRFRSIQAAINAADKAGYIAYTVQAATAWAQPVRPDRYL